MCVDSSGLNSPVAMETDGPLIEDVEMLKKTVEEEAVQVKVSSDVLYEPPLMIEVSVAKPLNGRPWTEHWNQLHSVVCKVLHASEGGVTRHTQACCSFPLTPMYCIFTLLCGAVLCGSVCLGSNPDTSLTVSTCHCCRISGVCVCVCVLLAACPGWL